jgi:hypothetical protein
MDQLKPLSTAAIPAALAKAERYRLLNEPWQAESICRDILAVDRDHQEATVMLILALTDQFDQAINAQGPLDLIPALNSAYQRAYYTGIIHERRAVAIWRQGDFRSGQVVHPLLREAMTCYERAETQRPPGNDDAVLRWNTCARFLRRIPHASAELEREQPVMTE